MYRLRSLIREFLTEGRVEDATSAFPSVDINSLSTSDPSGNNKYLMWMAKQVSQSSPENDVIQATKNFHRHQALMLKKDINQYRSLKELEDEIKRLETSGKLRNHSRRVERTVVKSEAPVVYESGTHLVIRPESKRACIQYGKATKWCITMANSGHYDRFINENDVFYFILAKEQKANSNFNKIAAQVHREESDNWIRYVDFYDETNKGYHEDEIKKELDDFDSIMSAIKTDVAKRPKSTIGKLRSGEKVTDKELVAYSKTLDDLQERQELLELVTDQRQKDMLADLLKLSGTHTDRSGTYVLNRYGQYHSIDDQPASISHNGMKNWYRNGKSHRDNDQPAVILGDGTKMWYQNGKRHRDNDQPAVIQADGTKMWYQHGKYIR